MVGRIMFKNQEAEVEPLRCAVLLFDFPSGLGMFIYFVLVTVLYIYWT